jgi:hypothetical protein
VIRHSFNFFSSEIRKRRGDVNSAKADVFSRNMMKNSLEANEHNVHGPHGYLNRDSNYDHTPEAKVREQDKHYDAIPK